MIILSVLLILRSIAHIGDAEARQRTQQYLDTSDRLTSAAFSSSVKKVKSSIDALDVAYHQSEDVLNDTAKSMYLADRSDLRDHLHDLEQGKWEKKADKYLQEFLDCYLAIVDGELEKASDVELLLKTKKRCIDQWQKYFAIDLSEYETTIYPKRYMRQWLGEDYDPCMESRDALEKKLSVCVEKIRPEHGQKRKAKEGVKVIPSSDKLVHDAIVRHLMDEGAEYIDMTHKGGGLYFFSESIADELKRKGYNIGYAENGSRSTSGRPAWYLRV